MTSRAVVEGPQTQGADETITYSITTTNWGSSPTSVSAVVKDITYKAEPDVSATVMPGGSISVGGNVITLKPLTALTAGHRYRVEVKFSSGSNVFEAYFIVEAET